MDVSILELTRFNTCPPFSLTYRFINETPCRRGQIVSLPVVNMMSWKILPKAVLLYPLQPLSTMLHRKEFSIYLFCFKNTNSSKALLSASVSLDRQILQEDGWTPDSTAADLQRWRNPSEIPQSLSFQAKCLYFGEQFYAPDLASHLSVLIFAPVCCGAVRTIFKDLDIPFPFSRDYEYLEDYLHWQMKE